MSDIAVAWAKAQTCWLRPGVKDRSAGQTLVHLASYADAEGEAYALVSLLAMEMDTSERTVQRGLAALKAAGLIKLTGGSKNHNGRLIPYYQLALDHGPANTRERLRIERAKAAPARSWGDTGVTPRTGAGRHGCHPTGDMGVRARGDTGVTQIGKLNSQGLTPSAGACASETDSGDVERDLAVAAWASKAPERVSPIRVKRAWEAAMARTGFASRDLRAAAEAAVAKDPDFGRGKAMNLDRWLDDGRYEPWMAASAPTAAGSARKAWDGPAEVLDAVAGAMGSGPVASYLDPAGWDEAGRTVRAATRHATDRLRQDAGRALKAIGVKVEFAGSAVRG